MPADPNKPRQWYWSRRDNGFSAKSRWHVIAAKLGMPPYQVIAFVNRLDELANEGDTRGYVGHFSAAEFAVELGMPAADTVRIYAALEEGENPWIVSDHIADFALRNPNREDPTSHLRDRRRNTRNAVLKQLARMAALDPPRISAERRASIEANLKLLPDPELFELPAQLAREELSTAAWATRGPQRVSVTPTPQNRTDISKAPVDNFADGASGAAAGPSDEGAETPGLTLEQKTELWLGTEGVRIIAERMFEDKDAATRRMLRWRDQQLGGDGGRLIGILRGADRADYVGPRFHNLIVDGIKAALREGAPQRELPIVAPLASERKLG